MRIRANNIIIVILYMFTLSSCQKEVFVESEQKTDYTDYNKIFISSNPTGSTIYIDGRTTGLVTPDTIKWVTNGTHNITLKRKYYWDTTVTVTSNNTTTSTAFVDYYQSERMLGQIDCSSTPSGAKIYIDNEYTGKVTPALLTRMLPKVHSVKLEFPEYRKDSLDIVVESSKRSFCGMTLEDTLDVITYNKINSNLPSNNYTCIAEDKYGNIWLGSQTEGLVVYDGKSFTKITTSNSPIQSNIIRRMAIDGDKNLWIGTSAGLDKYDGNSWLEIPSNMVTSLEVGNNNDVYAGTDRGGVIKYSKSQVTRIISSPNGLTNNDVISAICDYNGKEWIGLYWGGVDENDGGIWRHLSSENNELPLKYNSALTIDKNGLLYGVYRNTIGADKAEHNIAYYNNGKWTNIIERIFASQDYNKIYVDNKNNVWVGFSGTIFIVHNPSSYSNISRLIHSNIRKFVKSPSDLSKYINGNEVLVDSGGNLWIIGNKYDYGIIKIKAGRWDN